MKKNDWKAEIEKIAEEEEKQALFELMKRQNEALKRVYKKTFEKAGK